MYELILTQLAAKNGGVSKTVLGLIAKKLAEKVTEESQIEGVIADFENTSVIPIKDYADLLQAEGDKRVTEALAKAKAKAKAPTDPTPPADPKDVETPDVAQIVAAEIAKALAPFQQMTNTLQNTAKIAKLKESFKAKGIPEVWADDVVIDETFDEAATLARMETKWTETKQAVINAEVGKGRLIRGHEGGSDETFTQTVKDWNAQSAPTKEKGFNIQEV